MTIKIGPKSKRQIQKFAKDFNIDLNSAVNDFLRTFIKAGKTSFDGKFWQKLLKGVKAIH